ncbi:MAG: hypothetical protein ACQEQ4_02665 [Fibrobacterota bacterium]
MRDRICKTRCLWAALAILFFLGCTQNEVEFINSSDVSTVTVHFRSEMYELSSGDAVSIDGVPKGEYTYGTKYTVPPGMDEIETDIDGNLRFGSNTTKNTVEYITRIESKEDDDGGVENTFFISTVGSNTDGAGLLTAP